MWHLRYYCCKKSNACLLRHLQLTGSCNNATKFCNRKLQQVRGTWYCQKFMKQVLPLTELLEILYPKGILYPLQKKYYSLFKWCMFFFCFYLFRFVCSYEYFFTFLLLWWSHVPGGKFSKQAESNWNHGLYTKGK